MEKNTKGLQAIENEALKRREEINLKSKKPLPKYIKSILNTTVRYTVDTELLPYSLLNPSFLINSLKEKFNLKFHKPNFSNRGLDVFGINPQNVTEEAVLEFVMNSKEPELIFKNGRYITGPNTFVKIEYLAFSDELVTIQIQGISDIAELIIADAVNLFWEASGGKISWDSEDVQEKILLKSYSTFTLLDLGFDPKTLLNPSLSELFENQKGKKENYFSYMMPLSRLDDYKPSDSFISNWNFRELTLQINVFDSDTGRTNLAKLEIGTRARSETGKGIVLVSSELPYDTHIKLAEDLKNSIEKTAPKSSRLPIGD